ncbi:PREDICTED: WAT1-related protein At1g43650-like isoform X2 [Ipomoea nil]|uniref:WAT1-related protein At1g43650-like isoform X2 n=1 Tax=Ipomoea nil TaxID=35883 RepID=UPI000900C0DA|nr:PREDICTED: WAT1-related protein At1g43650-like isoform X2 [Ipomoea nil]
MELQGCMKPKVPHIAMLLVQLIYAGMALLSKTAIAQGMSPFIFVAYRQVFATIALAPFAVFLDRNNPVSLSYNILWKIFLGSFIGITLSLNLYCYAINYTSATFAAATTNIIPALTFVMAVISRVESLSIRQSHGMAKVLGCLISVSGALVFAFVKGPPVQFIHSSTQPQSQTSTAKSGELVKGPLLMLLANLLWSMWYIMQCLFSCLQSSVWAMAMERDIAPWRLKWDVNLVSVIYCGVIVTGITYWLQLWAVEKKGPVFIAVFTPLSLIITATISAILWKEKLYLGSVCGAILLIGGLYSFLWGQNREAEGQKIEGADETKDTKMECITHHQ